MGTFHPHAHPLHGITCVAKGPGPRCWVGRVDTVDAGCVVLLDADVHDASSGGEGLAEFLARAARVGPWRKHARVAVPLAEVTTLRPLSDYAASDGSGNLGSE